MSAELRARGKVLLMKKRIVAAIMCALLLCCTLLTSCGNLLGGETIEIAVIVDHGDVGAGSMNQAVWDVAANFAIANGKTYDAYQPESSSREDRIDIIMQAVVRGAVLVVCAGQGLCEAVYDVQDLFPDVTFLLIDGVPTAVDTENEPPKSGSIIDELKNNTQQDTTTVAESTEVPTLEPATKVSSNVYCVTFCEEQAGYLAGYAATRNGYTHFGFISERDSNSDLLYGYGFLQGVDDAARDMGIADRIKVVFRYSGGQMTEDELYNTAKSWYLSGTELVFAPGETFVQVIRAAEECNGRVICSDSDRSVDSNMVVTSAMKLLDKPIGDLLNLLKNNNYKWDAEHSGKSVLLGLDDGAVGLATSTWRFGAFTLSEYESVAARIVTGEVSVSTDFDNMRSFDIDVDLQS